MPSATTAEIRGDYCRIYRVKNIRQLYHESIFSSSLVVLFFLSKTREFFWSIAIFFVLDGKCMRPFNDYQIELWGKFSRFAMLLCFKQKKGDYFCWLISTIILRENDQSRRPKSSLVKHSFKLAPLEKIASNCLEVWSKVRLYWIDEMNYGAMKVHIGQDKD